MRALCAALMLAGCQSSAPQVVGTWTLPFLTTTPDAEGNPVPCVAAADTVTLGDDHLYSWLRVLTLSADPLCDLNLDEALNVNATETGAWLLFDGASDDAWWLSLTIDGQVLSDTGQLPVYEDSAAIVDVGDDAQGRFLVLDGAGIFREVN